jgi:hypothetical protein
MKPRHGLARAGRSTWAWVVARLTRLAAGLTFFPAKAHMLKEERFHFVDEIVHA